MNRDVIDTDELRAFEAVAVEASFTSAAKKLGMAQSLVSKKVANLESRVGRLLFRRTTRRVELSPAGSAMLVYARSILSLADDVRRSLEIPPVEGFIKIGIAEEFATTMLAGALGVFRIEHPQFEIRFVTARNDHLFVALENEKVDIVLGKCHSGRSRGELLWRESLLWAGHNWALKNAAGATVPLLAYLPPSETRELAEAALLGARRKWSLIAESENLIGLLAAAEAGLGVLPLGRTFIPPSLTDLSGVADLPAMGTVDYVIDRRHGRPNAATDAFVEVLRGVTSQLGASQIANAALTGNVTMS
jgi:DNA-binding transcriptional LysR family regulator